MWPVIVQIGSGVRERCAFPLVDPPSPKLVNEPQFCVKSKFIEQSEESETLDLQGATPRKEDGREFL